MTTQQVDNSQDVLDSRDVVERVEELRDELDHEGEDLSGATLYDEDEERAELATLEALLEQLSWAGSDRPEDGLTLVRDSFFQEYAMELADDLGVLPAEYAWPTSCIDWVQAARELQMDYTPVEFAGVTYWVR